MHFAAENGHLESCKLLVERGADVNGFGDVHGWDIIGWATLHHHTHTDVANYLLANGAQHNISAPSRWAMWRRSKSLARSAAM